MGYNPNAADSSAQQPLSAVTTSGPMPLSAGRKKYTNSQLVGFSPPKNNNLKMSPLKLNQSAKFENES